MTRSPDFRPAAAAAAASTRISRMVAFFARALIQYRKLLLVLCLAMTVAMGLSATRLRLDPGFNKMIPLQHPYMQIFTKYASAFSGANTVLVSLRWKGDGDIYNRTFMDKLRHATDDVFFIQGVERPRVYSLFTPNVRYTEVTEDGFRGDVVLPGLDAEAQWHVRPVIPAAPPFLFGQPDWIGGVSLSGRMLAEVGLRFPAMPPDQVLLVEAVRV